MKKFLIIPLIISVFSFSLNDIDAKKNRITQIDRQLQSNEKKINKNNNDISQSQKDEDNIKKQISDLNKLIYSKQIQYNSIEKKYVILLKKIGQNEQQIKQSLKDIENSNFHIVYNKGTYEELLSLWDKLEKSNQITEPEIQTVKEDKLLHDAKKVLNRQSQKIEVLKKDKKEFETVKATTEKAKKINERETYEINKTRIQVKKAKSELDIAKANKNRAVLKLQALQRTLKKENTDIQRLNKNLIAEKKRLEAQIKQIIAQAIHEKNLQRQKQKNHVPGNTPVKDIGALTTDIKGTGKLMFPIQGRIVLKYREEKIEGLASNGIEILGKLGQQVKASDAGVVLFTGTLNGLGSVIIIDHGDLITVYGNLASIRVAKGQKVKKGEIIGLLGRDAISDQPRLYFETRRGITTINPLGVL